MAEIRTIPEKILASGIKDTSIDTIGSFSKKVIHHNAGAPTAADDTGLGYAVGSIWVDSTNGDMYTCTVATAEDAVWINQEGDDVNFVQYTPGSSIGWIAGGRTPGSSPPGTGIDQVETFSLTSDGNATDVGAELTSGVVYTDTGKGPTYTYTVGGTSVDGPGASYYDSIQAMAIASPYGMTDWGESTQQWLDHYSCMDGTYVWNCGGQQGPAYTDSDTIDKFQTSSAANSTDVGESTQARGGQTSVTDSMGGNGFITSSSNPPHDTTRIEYFSLTSDGNGTDTTDELTNIQNSGSGWSISGSGFVAAGRYPQNINKFGFSSPYSGTDVGETNAQHGYAGSPGAASSTHGYNAGGHISSGSSIGDAIDKNALTSPYAATDVGEISHALSAAGSTAT